MSKETLFPVSHDNLLRKTELTYKKTLTPAQRQRPLTILLSVPAPFGSTGTKAGAVASAAMTGIMQTIGRADPPMTSRLPLDNLIMSAHQRPP